MHGQRTVALLVAAALAAVGGVGACGSDNGDGKRLSHATASELSSTLDRVEQDVDTGDCEAAATQARTLVERVGGLPDSVDADLRGALVDSADRLQVLVGQRCSTSSTGPSGPANSETTPETGPSGPTGKEKKQEKQRQPGKGKSKAPKHEQSGTTGQDQTGSTGGDNEDSGGVAP